MTYQSDEVFLEYQSGWWKVAFIGKNIYYFIEKLEQKNSAGYFSSSTIDECLSCRNKAFLIFFIFCKQIEKETILV
jgi:hypothetical protein